MESRALKERARHETILPFTRYLAGPADYTGMIFSERRGDTSVAHQIASGAVLASPLLTIAANPQSILNSPAVGLIRSIPPVWDETLVLPPSEIGELAIFARRKGDTWFLAAMCGAQPKSIQVPLSFLEDREYRATIAHDKTGDDSSVILESAIVKRGASLSIDMHGGGGFLASFVKAR
jgi:alpha-glucosidase